MLGVIPTIRRTTGTVLKSQLWNILILTPFIVAFWCLTEQDNDGSIQCGGLPWDVANFARWAFLGMAAYQLFSIPLNIIAAKKRTIEHLKRESIVTKRTDQVSYGTVTTHTEARLEDPHHRSERHQGEDGFGHSDKSRLIDWMRAFDTLFLMANWALWFYIIAAVVNRSQCQYRPLTHLLTATMWISVGFAIIGLILGAILLAKFLAKLANDIEQEAKFRVGTNHTVAQGNNLPVALGANSNYIANQDRIARAGDVQRPDLASNIASRVLDKAELAMNGAEAHLQKKQVPGERNDNIVNIREGARDEITRSNRNGQN